MKHKPDQICINAQPPSDRIFLADTQEVVVQETAIPVPMMRNINAIFASRNVKMTYLQLAPPYDNGADSPLNITGHIQSCLKLSYIAKICRIVKAARCCDAPRAAQHSRFGSVGVVFDRHDTVGC